MPWAPQSQKDRSTRRNTALGTHPAALSWLARARAEEDLERATVLYRQEVYSGLVFPFSVPEIFKVLQLPHHWWLAKLYILPSSFLSICPLGKHTPSVLSTSSMIFSPVAYPLNNHLFFFSIQTSYDPTSETRGLLSWRPSLGYTVSSKLAWAVIGP